MKALFFLLLFCILQAPAQAEQLPMIKGLDHLPVITQAESASFPPADGRIDLLCNGLSLPFDAASGTYFIPQDAASDAFDGAVTLQQKKGYAYYLLPDALCSKEEALTRSRGYIIYGTDGVHTDKSTVLFTALPVLSITTQQQSLPGEEDEICSIIYYQAHSGRLTAMPLTAEINLRGNTSKIFPKQSYRLQFVDAFGDNRHVSLAGLRTDDDWILNPLYTDSTKLREPLAYALWDVINLSGSAAQSSRIAYAEVFFNGLYHGLYGLQERVDLKQVDGSKKNDVLYKVRTNQQPTAEELLACRDRTACMAFEVENGDDFRGDSAALYRPAAAYMAFLDGKTLDPAISVCLDNAIDYGLFALLTQAHDSRFKNQFLNAVSLPGQTVLYKLPWDLNYTLGDVYQKELHHNNFTEYHIGSLVMDACFQVLLDAKDPAVLNAVAQRWQTLRRTSLSLENLSRMALALDHTIHAARARDHVRWPQGGRSEGNTGNHEEIIQYFSLMLPRIDAWAAQLVQTP